MTAREPLAPAGTAAAPRGSSSGALRNPHLGWRLFGYSRRKTDDLLDQAASMIEQLAADLVARRDELAETAALLERERADAGNVRVELDAAKREVLRLRSAPREEAGPEVDESAVGRALVSAHRVAAEIEADARTRAEEILGAARADSGRIVQEADVVIEQAEIRARALVERASAEVERLQSESERLREQIRRERAQWSAFLRRALDTMGEESPPPAPAEPASAQPAASADDLERDLRPGRATEPARPPADSES